MRFSGHTAWASLDWKGPIEKPLWAGLSTIAVWHSTMLHKEPFPAQLNTSQPLSIGLAGPFQHGTLDKCPVCPALSSELLCFMN
jgi:hypothetical protein